MSTAAKPRSVTLDDERIHPESADQATFQHHVARYRFALAQMRGGERVVDAGSGAGYGTCLLSERAAWALGVDYSPLAVGYAKEHYRRPNLAFAVMDAQMLALAAGTADLVVAFEVFEHLEDPEQFLQECRRVLRPGGRLILSTPNPETSEIHLRSIGQKNEFHINHLNHRELRRVLEKHFAGVTLYGQRRRGNLLYTLLRSADVFNLRLRLIDSRRRERLQQALGVPVGAAARPETWIFSRRQLRQANNFVAVCRSEG